METKLKNQLKSLPYFSYRLLPNNSGIYLFLGEKGNILYVGKAKNIKNRVSSYFAKSKDFGEKTRVLVSKTKRIKAIVTHSEIEALLLEANFIKKYKPRYNIRLADGKAYPLIRISIEDESPKVLIARKEANPSSIYFGPFPNAGALRLVLKIMRRIFPFQSVVNHPKKICLYNHLGLCPCPPIFNSRESKTEYRKNIRRLTSFLNGNTKKVIKELTAERNNLSKEEKYEKAQDLQKKINAILLITGDSARKFDSDTNPNLTKDLREKEISTLKEELRKYGVPVKKLKRIECYDISNTSGTNATGSMVVFTNGEKDSHWYRKFKIKYSPDLPNIPNDFSMITQVLQRRFNHPEWPMPDLIIVDGGKGQVSSALKTIKQFNNLTIPVIGLAKKEETIITSDFKEISLSKDSPALKLLMRIRDEAHRFAITYHKKLRSKSLLSGNFVRVGEI